MSMRKSGVAAAIAVVLSSPISADEPAVSQVNGKLEALGSKVDGEGASALVGSLTVPLGYAYGAQLDALGGDLDGDTIWGIGSHFFWRNPELGMFGFTAAQSHLDDIHLNRVGIEGEYYFNQFTLSAYGGRQSGDVPDTGYSGIAAAFYPNKNMMLQVSGDTVGDQKTGRIGVEWQPDTSMNGLSFFANASQGNNNRDAVMIGARVYFSDDKSLQERHRKDDPVNPLFNNLVNSLGELASEQCRVESGYYQITFADEWDPSCDAKISSVTVCNGVVTDFVSIVNAKERVAPHVLGKSLDQLTALPGSGSGGGGCLF